MFIRAETGLVATRQECVKTNNHESTFLKKAKLGVTNVMFYLSPTLFLALQKELKLQEGKKALEYLS